MKKPAQPEMLLLDRPLAPGVESVNPADISFSDLSGVLCGVKPVAYIDCVPGRVPAIKGLCDKLKLKFSPLEDLSDRRGLHFVKNKKFFLLGRHDRDIKAAASAWNRSLVGEEWGCMLGYPRCCAKAYEAWGVLKAGLDPEPDIIGFILGRTRRPAKLDFRLNNVWNYFSRMNFAKPEDCRAYDNLMALNGGMFLASKHIVSWHPCSYECPESLKKAAAIFSFMRRHAPAYAAHLEDMLARPVLFVDKFKYMVFDGKVAGGTLNYKAVIPPRSLLSANLCKLAASCDGVKAGERGTGFYRGDRLVFSSPDLNSVLLNFTKPG